MSGTAEQMARLRQQAETLLKNQQLDAAKAAYRQLCQSNPGDAQSWHMLSAVTGMLGELDESESCCRKVLQLQPNVHGAWLNLANILMAKQRFAEARQAYQRAVALNPDDPQSHINLGNLCLREGQVEFAITHYRQALTLDPNAIEAYNNLGTALRESGDKAEAECCLRRAIELRPDYTDAVNNLANLYVDNLQYDEAEQLYRHALQLNPRSAASHCNLGKLQQSRGNYEEAEKVFNYALHLAPADPETCMAKADLLEKQGDIDAAFELLQPLIGVQTLFPKAVLSCARLSQRRNDYAPAIDALEKLLATSLTPNLRIDAHFQLGELYDRSSDYERAFANFDTANKLEPHRYDADAHARYIEAIQQTYSAAAMPRLPRSEQLCELPVFIVGMPRSGTSLVEQILASHPQVTGGGELGGVSAIASGLPARMGVTALSAGFTAKLTSTLLADEAQAYITDLQARAAGTARFTDKDPLQFLDAGFIRLLLPGSRIIHCTREPLDTCLSIYFHRFNQYHAYACDLAGLGHFYLCHQKLMEHWQNALDTPPYQVRYENMVAEQEAASRALVDFCGLDWDDQCLRFYETKRVVNTPSYDQVRKPIYQASVARWKNYEKFLGPLLDALGM